ncbi:MAG: NAD(P)H-dependent oxidoreductase [Chromatiaceae bacterium]|nr:NAD(P)H-dependent oxidoreductase [Gammaproteobacteria bacterium]MCP5301129.1 NAD(P)H-dependent oxidoreductase [Chromatiaceae bacterium]MCP5421399.1 NAD(P)H-dependent oxidoreductase [Chromatiaceae bacterium]
MQDSTVTRVLRIDSGVGGTGSVSRELGDEIIRRLHRDSPRLVIDHVDLTNGIDAIDHDWVAANFTMPAERDATAGDRLVDSDRAIAALSAADAVVITAPIYNFSIPSTLKAWIDHVCRAGVTFRYTPQGPQGLLADRPVYLAMASGGVAFGSAADFASTYLRHVLGFIGIADVRLVGAAGVARERGAAIAAALDQLDQWLPALAGEAA